MKIACVSTYDALDPRSLGGRVYHHLQAIRRCEEVTMQFIGPLSYWRCAPLLFLKREFYRRAIGLKYFPRRDKILVKDFARQISSRLKVHDADVIFSPLSPASQPIAFLDVKKPIVIWTDTTFAGVLDVYPEFMQKTMCAESIRDGIENERSALNRAALAIYYSEWAARFAIGFYNLNPEKVRVVSPGPAFNGTIDLNEAKKIVQTRGKDLCRLLFVGSSWERKGGDLALEVVKRLNERGLPSELVVVGCVPPVKSLPPFVRVLGFIDSTTEAGGASLAELYKTSHFLLVPSIMEAFGLVFAEANAFALPSVTTDVGGIPQIIRSGVNGATFHLSDGPELYCAFIETLFRDRRLYEITAIAAFAEFHCKLNNRTAAASVIRAVEEIL